MTSVPHGLWQHQDKTTSDKFQPCKSSRDSAREEPKVRSPHLDVYPNLPRGQLSFSLLRSPCLMKAVLFLQPGPCLHPSLGFGLFVWSAQILQRISPWHNMLRVPRFNWHRLVPCIGLSAGCPVRARHVRAHQTSHMTNGLTVSSQGGCCNRLIGSAKGWELVLCHGGLLGAGAANASWGW